LRHEGETEREEEVDEEGGLGKGTEGTEAVGPREEPPEGGGRRGK